MLYVLNSETTKSQSEENKGGVAQLNLSLSQLKDYSILLPPLAEQQRIVAKLDAAFAEIDRAIDLTRQREASLISFKGSLLSSELRE
jgi:type I restriction enzyme S subunit